MKRFYKDVSTGKTPQGHQILLDGKPIKTPAKQDLLCPSEDLAAIIRAEWDAQEADIDPAQMPVTQLLSTAIDRVSHDRAQIQSDILTYIESDLMFFRTDHPPELTAAQAAKWDQWMDYSREKWGELPEATFTLTIPEMPSKTAENLTRYVTGLSLYEFTMLAHLTTMSGSLLLAAAFLHGDITVDQFTEAALCEEFFYVDFYGTAHNGLDPQLEAKNTAMRRDLEAIQSLRPLL